MSTDLMIIDPYAELVDHRQPHQLKLRWSHDFAQVRITCNCKAELGCVVPTDASACAEIRMAYDVHVLEALA